VHKHIYTPTHTGLQMCVGSGGESMFPESVLLFLQFSEPMTATILHAL